MVFFMAACAMQEIENYIGVVGIFLGRRNTRLFEFCLIKALLGYFVGKGLTTSRLILSTSHRINV